MFFNNNQIPDITGGRTTIDSRGRTTSFSRRSAKGNLDVIRKDCPYCHHHKALTTYGGITKCSRCKRRLSE